MKNSIKQRNFQSEFNFDSRNQESKDFNSLFQQTAKDNDAFLIQDDTLEINKLKNALKTITPIQKGAENLLINYKKDKG